ncbi:MAG TPA: alpha/beta hydrolase [Rhizomicrobium sp.]|jgi:pimeloyl-ACP methyl ester carboxylesterase
MLVTEHTTKSPRHTSFYLAAGCEDAVPIVFVHGWPELSISWRHQLPSFASLGFRAIAPDMRGYGRSSTYSRHEDYAVEHAVQDMIELLDAIGHRKAVWVGHDWGSPVVWSIASHHPERCHGIANLCVPYMPAGFAPETIIPLVDRAIYPEAQFPAGQWEYMMFYRENFDKARRGFEHNVTNTVKAMFRAGGPDGKGSPAMTAFTRLNNGFFGPLPGAPDVPRDESVLTEEDLHRYASALERNGFFGPDSWYMNGARNIAFASHAKNGGRIDLPVLFVHAAYDYVCATVDTPLPGPMREYCRNLTEATVESGHWMAQEKPVAVNAALAKWLVMKLPEVWVGS